MTEYIPLGTKVLLKKIHPKEVQGKIITIDKPKDKMIAEVIAFPDGHSSFILEGEKVRYAPYQAQVIDEDNPDFLIVDEKDIWCIVRE